MLRGLAVVLMGLTAVACVPTERASPTAVTPGSAGKIRILQTDCELDGVVQVEVVGDNGDGIIDEKDPRYWQVDFKTPVKIRAFETGVVPAGGEERVPWREPPRDENLAAVVNTDSGMRYSEQFKLGELRDGQFRYLAITMTREEFEKEAPCALK